MLAVTALLVLLFDFGVAGAALAAVVAGGDRHSRRARRSRCASSARASPTGAPVRPRTASCACSSINRDIMIRTAALIVVLAFFAAQGARAGDMVLAANAVLHNLVLVGAFSSTASRSAAEQLCGRAVGARDRAAFSRAVRLSIVWGFGFGVATTLR